MHRRILDRCFRTKISLSVLAVLAINGCVTLEHNTVPALAPIDTPDCFDLTFNDDVPITISVDERSIALAYEEMGNHADELAGEQTQFTHVYLILTGVFENTRFIPRIARLTINIWIVDSSEPTKTCYQWRLTDEDWNGLIDYVAGEIIAENQEDTVTEIRPLYTSNRDMDEYSRLYRSCRDYLLNRSTLRSLVEI